MTLSIVLLCKATVRHLETQIRQCALCSISTLLGTRPNCEYPAVHCPHVCIGKKHGQIIWLCHPGTVRSAEDAGDQTGVPETASVHAIPLVILRGWARPFSPSTPRLCGIGRMTPKGAPSAHMHPAKMRKLPNGVFKRPPSGRLVVSRQVRFAVDESRVNW